MSTMVLAKTKFCSAILGIGLLALTGCGGGSTSASVIAADLGTSATTTAPASGTGSSPSTHPAPPTPTPEPSPEIVVSEEWAESEIPFDSVRQDDPNAELGVESVLVAGAAGVKATRFEVTVTDGVETGRIAAGEEVLAAPVNEVIGVGSKAPVVAPLPPPPAPVQAAVPAPVQAAAPAGNCDSNYEGACVPIDSDVDCASGSGNGPSYVEGPVYVVGTDIYGLDGNDNDGIGCE